MPVITTRGALSAGGFGFATQAAFTGTISFFGSNTSTTTTITYPASTQPGDLSVLLDSAVGFGGIPSSVYPTGYTAIGVSASGTDGGGAFGVRYNASYRVLTGGDGTPTGMSGNGMAKVLLVFRKTSGTWGAPSDIAAQVNLVTPPGNQTVNVGSAPLIVLGFGDAGSGGSAADALTMNPAGTYVATTGSRGGYIVYNASPANNTVSTTSGFALGSFYIPLGP